MPTRASTEDGAIGYGPARLREVAKIARLYRAQTDEGRQRFHPLPFSALPLGAVLVAITVGQRGRHVARRIVPGAGALLWVARRERSGQVVGFLVGRLRRGPDGPVVRTGLMVDPSARRLGIGVGLKRSILEEGRRLGLRRVEAVLLPSNTAAVRMHESLGSEIHPVRFHDRRSPETRYLLASQEISPANPGAPGRRSPGPAGAAAREGP